MLELDHVFCMVSDPDDAVRRLEDDGWKLDAGQAHAGQGTRNRRLAWTGVYFELLWVTDVAEARANPLRLDRRGAWPTSGASPIGIALRGWLEGGERDAYWLYDALGPRIHVHRDNERDPRRPLVFVLESGEREMRARRARPGAAHRHPGALREIRVGAPSAPSLPAFEGPPIVHVPGAHLLELVADGDDEPLQVSEGLVIRR